MLANDRAGRVRRITDLSLDCASPTPGSSARSIDFGRLAQKLARFDRLKDMRRSNCAYRLATNFVSTIYVGATVGNWMWAKPLLAPLGRNALVRACGGKRTFVRFAVRSSLTPRGLRGEVIRLPPRY